MRQWTIDAFAAAAFRGNPACVVEPFDSWPDAAWMQALAAENNQAETAFLLRSGDPARFGLRWFTPALEAPLCGHATLASAHALLAEIGLPAPVLTFDTLAGPLTVKRLGDGPKDDAYEMDFPADPPRPIPAPPGLTEALWPAGGAGPVDVWAGNYLLVILESEAAVRALRPDLSALARIGEEAAGGRGNLGVCALADAGAAPRVAYDVVTRFFAPGSGIPEDPTTGSFHCIAAPLFAERLGRAAVRFHQAYPGRGGDLECVHQGKRVLLRGRAVTTVESVLKV